MRTRAALWCLRQAARCLHSAEWRRCATAVAVRRQCPLNRTQSQRVHAKSMGCGFDGCCSDTHSAAGSNEWTRPCTSSTEHDAPHTAVSLHITRAHPEILRSPHDTVSWQGMPSPATRPRVAAGSLLGHLHNNSITMRTQMARLSHVTLHSPPAHTAQACAKHFAGTTPSDRTHRSPRS